MNQIIHFHKYNVDYFKEDIDLLIEILDFHHKHFMRYQLTKVHKILPELNRFRMKN